MSSQQLEGTNPQERSQGHTVWHQEVSGGGLGKEKKEPLAAPLLSSHSRATTLDKAYSSHLTFFFEN